MVDEIRRKAENILQAQSEVEKIADEKELHEIIHELHVHQIELEIQNEQLKETQSELALAKTRYYELYHFAPVGYCIFDEDGVIVHLNLRAAEILGRELSSLSGKPILPFLSSESNEAFYHHRQLVMSSEIPQTCELTLRPQEDHEITHIEMVSKVDFNAEKERVLLNSVITDITVRKQAEAELYTHQHHLEKLLEHHTRELRDRNKQIVLILETAQIGICLTDEQGRFVEVNKTYCQIYGFTPAELIGQHFTIHFPYATKAEKAELIEQYHTFVQSSENYSAGKYTVYKKDSTELIIDVTRGAFRRKDGTIFVVTTVVDITMAQRLADELQEQQALSQKIFNNIPVMIVIYDQHGDFEFINQAAETTLGWHLDEFWEIDVLDLIFPDPQTREKVRQFMLSNDSSEWVDFEMRCRDGRILQSLWTNVELPDGRLVGIGIDITERKRMEQMLRLANEQLKQLASIDGLTEIANRRQFDNYLAHQWQQARELQAPFALIFGDIDYFKAYNDTYGHQQGDECLRHVARTLAQALEQKEALVARYGGEEFGIVLPDITLTKARQILRCIQREIASLKIEHESSEVSAYVTLSLGLSYTDTVQTTTKEELLELADQAMYRAKTNGRNRFEIIVQNET